MKELTQLSVESFFNNIAERTPTPGGGSVTAAGAALACSMARMVVAYSLGPKTEPAVARELNDVAERLHTSDEILRALITQDAAAYETMTRLAKDHKEGRATSREHQDAVVAAIAIPLEIAAVCAHLLTLADDVKANVNRYLVSDLGVAAALANGAARAAEFTVLVNAAEVNDAKLRAKVLSDIAEMTRRASERAVSVEDFVRRSLQPDASARR